jgi:hypothetical protein
MSESFKKTILEYEKTQQAIKNLNDQLAPYQKKLKQYKERTVSLESKIVDYMMENKMGGSKLELGDVVITMGETKRTETVSKDFLLKKCIEFLKDEKMAKKLVDYVYGSRQQNVSNCLRRKVIKKKSLKNN